MDLELQYKLQQFREVEKDYFDENGEKYMSTPIGVENSELMLQLINELEGALEKAETSNESEKVCLIHRCNEPVYKRGVCKKHFKDCKL